MGGCQYWILGQGLSVATGIALGLKKKSNKKVFVMVGDGEIQEGQVWESLMFSSHHKLDNLIIILDYNKIQVTILTKTL